MKNTKEINALITAIYCINNTNGNEDKDIKNLCRYIFFNCTNGNPNMLDVLCVGMTKETMLPYLMELLGEETQFKKYMEKVNK